MNSFDVIIHESTSFGKKLLVSRFALACDIRYANVTAKMGLTETRLAIFPGE